MLKPLSEPPCPTPAPHRSTDVKKKAQAECLKPGVNGTPYAQQYLSNMANSLRRQLVIKQAAGSLGGGYGLGVTRVS